MTFDASSDPILRSVSRLTVLTSDEGRAGRLRARCRMKLGRRAPAPKRAVGPAVVAGLCLLYLSAVVHDVLRLHGLF